MAGILRDVCGQFRWQIFAFIIFNNLANSERLKGDPSRSGGSDRTPVTKRLSSNKPMHYRCTMPFPRPKKVYSEGELYEYAVGALGRRMRTVAELKRLLRQKVEADTEFGQTLVELIIRRLKDQGYLNDAKYAAAFSSLRRDNEKFGRMRVITDLKIKGVHGDVIDTAVSAAFDEVNDERQARAYLQRKRVAKPKDQKQAARIFRQLTRAGFRSKTIFTILKKWDVDEEVLTALEGETAE
jgi:regulatory protein